MHRLVFFNNEFADAHKIFSVLRTQLLLKRKLLFIGAILVPDQSVQELLLLFLFSEFQFLLV